MPFKYTTCSATPGGVTPESLESARRFARWAERRGYVSNPHPSTSGRRGASAASASEAVGVSEGRRSIAQLETAGVERPVGRAGTFHHVTLH